MTALTEAPVAWNLLNGVVCLFKTAGETAGRTRGSFLAKLCHELNSMECRPPRLFKAVAIDENGEKSLIERPSYADHPLVVGPRYQQRDFKCSWATYLGEHTSGVLVVGLNKGVKLAYNVHHSYPMRTYHVKGEFGILTDNLYKTGRILDKMKFKHIRLQTLERLLEKVQASHQRQMFELSGVDIQSQEAYELAAKGLVRPAKSDVPVVYGVKCIDFNPPEFSIEVHCINEYEAYLMALIQNIGQHLRSLATCTGIQCIKHSHFTLDNALLRKHWDLENVIHNLAENRRIIRKHGKLNSTIRQVNAANII